MPRLVYSKIMTKNAQFIHLRLHSEYSLLEGAMRLKKLPDLCQNMAMPAVAVTDSNNLFAALEFSVSASAAGVQPILGCQIDLAYAPVPLGGRKPPPAPIVLLAQSETGYENLLKLNSCLYLKADGELPQVSLEDLKRFHKDLICLTGGADGPVGCLLRAGQAPAAEALMQQFSEIYGDRLYVELQRHPGETGLPEAERLTEA